MIEKRIDRTMKHFVKRMEKQCLENRVMTNHSTSSIGTVDSSSSVKVIYCEVLV